jgi:hypothetical protein
MLSRRQKNNVFFFIIGFFSGGAIVVFIVFFGMIADFTKDKAVQILRTIPSNDAVPDTLAQVQGYERKKNIERIALFVHDTVNKKAVLESDTETVKVAVLPPVETVKTDHKIAEAVLIIEHIVHDSLVEESQTVKEIKVEQWENPTNFTGYKLSDDMLIIYGMDLKQISLQLIDGNLFIFFSDKSIPLKKSNDFEHFAF